MESITLDQVKNFDRKRTKWIEDFKDFKTRWLQYTDELKNANTHSLEVLTTKRKIFEEEQARLNAAAHQINYEYKEIKYFLLQAGFIIWPEKFSIFGGTDKWLIYNGQLKSFLEATTRN